MNDDGVESDSVKEVEGQSEGFQIMGEDRSAYFDDGKVSRGGEDLEVTRDFAAGGEGIEKSDDGFLRDSMEEREISTEEGTEPLRRRKSLSAEKGDVHLVTLRPPWGRGL